MDEKTLQAALRELPLGGLRYFPSIGSTNDEALAWAAAGAANLSLVVADEQTTGRGRAGRKWFTPPGSALAFSLILRPAEDERPHLTRTVGLAALALSDSLRTHSLEAQIKWPNDILIAGQKAAGILVESVWNGEDVDCAVIGMGINISKGSVPPPEELNFPATSLEENLGVLIDREQLLRDVLAALIEWRPRLGSDEFLAAWEARLAFRGQQIQIQAEGEATVSGELLGLAPDGSLRVREKSGNAAIIRFGDVRLRPGA